MENKFKMPEKTEEQLKAETEAKRKAEQLKKEAEAKAKLPKPKYYYDVKVECLLPATLTYKILAEDPHQAVELMKGKSPNSVQHRLIGRKELKLIVYDAGCTFIRFMKMLGR